jgi:hypothetical protein
MIRNGAYYPDLKRYTKRLHFDRFMHNYNKSKKEIRVSSYRGGKYIARYMDDEIIDIKEPCEN